MDDDLWDAPPRIFFSVTEILHLLASVVVLTLAFAFILGKSSITNWNLDATILALAAVAVVPAFILHELAHKFVAQRKDMWAEFRANFIGLIGGFILTALSGFLFAVPGAVHIVGNASKRDAGVISIVGPMVNLCIAAAAYVYDRVARPIQVADFGSFAEVLVLLNCILAAFNMLPIGPLDGRKVWAWSKMAFFGTWLAIAGLLALQLAVGAI